MNLKPTDPELPVAQILMGGIAGVYLGVKIFGKFFLDHQTLVAFGFIACFAAGGLLGYFFRVRIFNSIP